MGVGPGELQFQRPAVAHADQVHPISPPLFSIGQPATTLEWPWSGSANNLERWCVDRHNTMVNMALTDGGSRSVRLSDLWGLKWNMTFNTNLVRPVYP